MTRPWTSSGRPWRCLTLKLGEVLFHKAGVHHLAGELLVALKLYEESNSIRCSRVWPSPSPCAPVPCGAWTWWRGGAPLADLWVQEEEGGGSAQYEGC